MNQLKRLLLLFVVAVSIGTTAVAAPAQAEPWPGASGACQNGFGTETNITDNPIAISVETSPDYFGETRALVCWRIMGGPTTEWAGGNLYVSYFSDGTVRVLCEADRPSSVIIAADCGASATPHDPNPASAGMTVDGTVALLSTSPTYIGETGAEAGDLTYTHSASTTETKQVGTCLYVLGAQMLPGCQSLTTNVWTANSDIPSYGTTGSQCAVALGGWCYLWIDKSYVVTGSDTTQNTVSGTLVGQGIWLLDIPFACVGFCP